MNKEELEKRQERAKTENFIIAKTDEGFRVCSPLTPANQYLVVGSNEGMTCTCPDFQEHVTDPEWRCKHVLAVQNHLLKQNHDSSGDNSNDAAAKPVSPRPTEPAEAKKTKARDTNGAEMRIKRSVSPDGRIDSLSVEFSCPVGRTSTAEIKQQAEKTLKLQSEIMQSFLQANGKSSSAPQGNGGVNDPAVTAELLAVGAMDTKRGRSMFLNILVNNQIAKLFGSQKQLSETVATAGYPTVAAQVREGLALNLPCRVVTKQNGKYLNIERVLPAQTATATRG